MDELHPDPLIHDLNLNTVTSCLTDVLLPWRPVFRIIWDFMNKTEKKLCANNPVHISKLSGGRKIDRFLGTLSPENNKVSTNLLKMNQIKVHLNCLKTNSWWTPGFVCDCVASFGTAITYPGSKTPTHPYPQSTAGPKTSQGFIMKVRKL